MVKADTSIVRSTMQEVTEAPKKFTLEDYINQRKTEILQALPKMVSVERFSRVAITAYKTSSRLRECDMNSFLASVMTAAQLGLEVNTPLGEAYIIPYGQKAQFQIGYRGMLSLAYRSGMFKRIDAREVFEEDAFEYNLGIPSKLYHVPADKNSGKIVKYYALYELTNGGYNFVVESQENLMRFASQYSQAYQMKKKDSPWFTAPSEMCKKTLLKKLLKLAPMSVEYRQIFETDETIKTELHPNMPELPNEAIINTTTGELVEQNKQELEVIDVQPLNEEANNDLKGRLQI